MEKYVIKQCRAGANEVLDEVCGAVTALIQHFEWEGSVKPSQTRILALYKSSLQINTLAGELLAWRERVPGDVRNKYLGLTAYDDEIEHADVQPKKKHRASTSGGALSNLKKKLDKAIDNEAEKRSKYEACQETTSKCEAELKLAFAEMKKQIAEMEEPEEFNYEYEAQIDALRSKPAKIKKTLAQVKGKETSAQADLQKAESQVATLQKEIGAFQKGMKKLNDVEEANDNGDGDGDV